MIFSKVFGSHLEGLELTIPKLKKRRKPIHLDLNHSKGSIHIQRFIHSNTSAVESLSLQNCLGKVFLPFVYHTLLLLYKHIYFLFILARKPTFNKPSNRCELWDSQG